MSTHTQSPAVIPLEKRRAIFKKFEAILDKLIALQREEQEVVLNREVIRLPEISGKIAALSTELEKMRPEMQSIRDLKPINQEEEFLRKTCIEKFLLMQELAQQNHMLIENCMKFLAKMMTEFVGAQKRNTVYNQVGALGNAFAESGMLVDIRA